MRTEKRFIASLDEAIVEIEKPNRFVLVNFSCMRSDPVLVDNYTKTKITLSWDVVGELSEMGILEGTDRKSPSRRFHMSYLKRSELII